MDQLINMQEFRQYIVDSFSIDEKEFDRLMDEINSFYTLEVQMDKA